MRLFHAPSVFPVPQWHQTRFGFVEGAKKEEPEKLPPRLGYICDPKTAAILFVELIEIRLVAMSKAVEVVTRDLIHRKIRFIDWKDIFPTEEAARQRRAVILKQQRMCE